MSETAISPMLTPIVQWGFAGFCGILLAMLAWVFTTVFTLQRETLKQVSANTEVVRSVSVEIGRLSAESKDVRDRLLQRPCVADFMRTKCEDAI